MINRFLKLFKAPRPADADAPTPRIVFTDAALAALRPALVSKTRARHEGIVYFVGRTDGYVTLITSVFIPEATTTHGSFNVSARSMAKLVEFAASHGLQVVGQLHTHPMGAFHSDGDIEGTHIHYQGYVSMVVPNYGAALPSLADAHILRYERIRGWQPFFATDVKVVRSAAK